MERQGVAMWVEDVEGDSSSGSRSERIMSRLLSLRGHYSHE